MRERRGVERIGASETFHAVRHAVAVGIGVWVKPGGAVNLFPDVAHAVEVQIHHLGLGAAEAAKEQKQGNPSQGTKLTVCWRAVMSHGKNKLKVVETGLVSEGWQK